MNYSFEEKNKKEIGNSYAFVFLDDEKQEDFHELSINEIKYLFEGFCSVIPFKDDGVIVVNTWNSIVIFSLIDGKILYFSGLNESFVGIESLNSDYLIVTDLSLFLINKNNYYPWGYKIMLDFVQGYELLDKDYTIRISLATESKITIKLNEI